MRILLVYCLLSVLALSGCKKDMPSDLLLGHWEGVSTRHTIVSSNGSRPYDSTQALTSTLDFAANGTLSPGISYTHTGSDLYLDFGNYHINATIQELTATKLVYQYSFEPNVLVLPNETAVEYVITSYKR